MLNDPAQPCFFSFKRPKIFNLSRQGLELIKESHPPGADFFALKRLRRIGADLSVLNTQSKDRKKSRPHSVVALRRPFLAIKEVSDRFYRDVLRWQFTKFVAQLRNPVTIICKTPVIFFTIFSKVFTQLAEANHARAQFLWQLFAL